jgi:hypothetical protein
LHGEKAPSTTIVFAVNTKTKINNSILKNRANSIERNAKLDYKLQIPQQLISAPSWTNAPVLSD